MLVLIVDDSEMNNLIMAEAVRGIAGCQERAFTSPVSALAFVASHAAEIGVAITDWDMPEMNGTAFTRAARKLAGFEHVPIVMVTSSDQRSIRAEAFNAGVTDFMMKPFDPTEIRARVTNLLALNRARLEQTDRAAWLQREVAAALREVENREREIVSRLARAAEHRDGDTGDHLSRVADFVQLIAEGLGFDPERCKLLALASTMHDVGKIGVPDAVLLKKGRLTPEERALIESHALQGHEILKDSASDLVRLAAEIALSHHERWDGEGYPHGLAGDAIPIAGRIVAVADVFDALTSQRPYKLAWSCDAARDYLEEGSGSHFDPVCVQAFLARWSDVLDIARSGQDRAELGRTARDAVALSG